VIVNEPPLSLAKKLRRIVDRCFMVTGPVEGKVLASGFCVNYGATGRRFNRLTPVDFLAGGVCAYRKAVFEHFLFDENIKGYGLGEDKDFSYRLSKHYRLVISPDAHLNHYESPKMRFDKKRMGFEFVISRYRFFRTHVYNHPLSSIAFYYALFGYTLGRSVITILSFKKHEYQCLSGILGAIANIVSSKAKQDLADDQQNS
jgi:GT2 family glycosyltransferase